MPYEKLLLGLRDGNYFCLYKLKPRKNGKEKKVPYWVSGARTDLGNKAHLSEFATAYETYHKSEYGGIALSVMEDIVAVDI